jgi:hypothetical protein
MLALGRVGLIPVLAVQMNNTAGFKLLLLVATGFASLAASKTQMVTLGPELDGTLTIDGKKAQGAEVLVGFSGNHDNPCKGLTPSAHTDKNGWFHVPARTARLSAKEIKAIPYGTTVNYVCFRSRNQLIVDGMFLIEPSNHKRYTADCRSPRATGATGEDAQICWWRWHTANNSFKPNPLRSSKTPSGSSGGSA